MTGQLKQKKPLPPSPIEVLREFVQHIESVYHFASMISPLRVAEELDADEYRLDLAQMYAAAKEVLEHNDRMRYDAAKPLKIQRWIASGEFANGEDQIGTFKELLEAAGRPLDKSCVYEIFGDVLFEAEDGVLYTMSVEAEIAPASDACIQDIENLIEEMRDDDQS